MHRGPKLLGQHRIYEAVALDGGQALEARRHNDDVEVRLAAVAGAALEACGGDARGGRRRAMCGGEETLRSCRSSSRSKPRAGIFGGEGLT